MARLEVGPSLARLIEDAERRVNAQAAAQTAPLAIYANKAIEARAVLDGASSRLIEAEAALRGLAPAELAGQIVEITRLAEDRELARVALIQRIRAADKIAVLEAVLAAAGFTLTG